MKSIFFSAKIQCELRWSCKKKKKKLKRWSKQNKVWINNHERDKLEVWNDKTFFKVLRVYKDITREFKATFLNDASTKSVEKHLKIFSIPPIRFDPKGKPHVKVLEATFKFKVLLVNLSQRKKSKQ